MCLMLDDGSGVVGWTIIQATSISNEENSLRMFSPLTDRGGYSLEGQYSVCT
jgi:hypothetical protein